MGQAREVHLAHLLGGVSEHRQHGIVDGNRMPGGVHDRHPEGRSLESSFHDGV
jgi:hypothetical protein